MNVTIISVGKIKEKYLNEGIKEFSKRLSKYCKLKLVEVNDEKAPENLSETEMEIVKKKEGERILGKLNENSYIIALCIDGKSLSSEEFSKKLDSLALSGNSNITFIIGGSLGLSQDVINKSHFKLSFSKMTFPHQLMKLILLEQIYRAFRISRGEPL
ncbi:23S rRNA (pseudouridine1915-N3)-methyltransferase [Caloranaerobacter azorensis DSM 13643]|uniref:Ribosomal RNA large subunit methyltransferase H n=1 Tax=Caloranaerobacter azorensis DSM 13643 TaxID=1121264 RepID=A0A1M5VKJ2_9FIRM|nr:23S rRNA (pseudouridine(1915)-N(3))-methyltransferase RlmH [Caloranaerobacter azorensis]SHH75782.1 23S rRNA (pseudouridine1915-N3)-methyltransferase [Caloranaerobacter azorensis DSM 13643]